jgi:hypothetical protein
MARHAGLGRGHPGRGGAFDRAVAVAASDAETTGMDVVTEGDRLLDRLADIPTTIGAAVDEGGAERAGEVTIVRTMPRRKRALAFGPNSCAMSPALACEPRLARSPVLQAFTVEGRPFALCERRPSDHCCV